ncbi:MAG: LPS translocon maturation chaperone LptM [Steroidobacteraceae bacterium]
MSPPSHSGSTRLTIWLTMAALGALSACGQIGPLYLPDASPDVVITGPQDTPPTP